MNFARKIFFSFLYLSNPPWDTGITPPEVVAFVDSHPAGRALDLGCGTGTNSIYLAKHGWQVTGVDFIGRAIRFARNKAKQAGEKVKFLHEDVAQLKGVSGQFDLILDIGCYHGLPEKEQKAYLDNVTQLLSPQGTFHLYAFTKEAEDGPGLSNKNLEEMQNRLELVDRQDGTDRNRTSSWFMWRLP